MWSCAGCKASGFARRNRFERKQGCVMNETILAIDPGTTESAYVEYTEGRLGIFDKIPNMELLRNIGLWQMDADPRFGLMAIEMPACYGMAVGKSVFETCRWVGIFQHAFGVTSTHLVYRKSRNHENGVDSVAMHLCKNNRAKDPNVRQAILDRYEPTGGGRTPQIGTKSQPGPLYGVSGDVWSALAVAITFDETFIRCRNT